MNYDKFKVSFVTLDAKASKSFNDEKEAFDFAKKIKNKVNNLKIVGIKDGVKNELDFSGNEKKEAVKKEAVKKAAVKKAAVKNIGSEFSKKVYGKNKVVNLTVSDVGWISNAIRFTLDYYFNRSSLLPSEKEKIEKNLNSIFKTIQGGGTFQFTSDEVNRILICLRHYYKEIQVTNKSKAPRVYSLIKFFEELKNEDSKTRPS